MLCLVLNKDRAAALGYKAGAAAPDVVPGPGDAPGDAPDLLSAAAHDFYSCDTSLQPPPKPPLQRYI